MKTVTKVQFVFNSGDDIIGVIEDASEDQEFQIWLHVAYPDIGLTPPFEIEKPNDFIKGLLADEGR